MRRRRRRARESLGRELVGAGADDQLRRLSDLAPFQTSPVSSRACRIQLAW